jgi:hypothetical protein
MIPTPVALGLFLCRDVQFFGPDLRVDVLGQFSILELPAFPSVAPPFCAYSVLKGSFGTGTVRVCVYRLANHELVSVAERPIFFTDRLQMLHTRILMDQCRFPEEGRYDFYLMVDHDVVAQTVLDVTRGEPV